MIFVSTEYPPGCIAQLRQNLPEFKVYEFNPKQGLPDNFNEAKGLLIRSSFSVHKALIEKTPHLKWVVTSTSGFDHIDLKACGEKGITASYTPEGNIQSVVELTLYFILNLFRQFGVFQKGLEDLKWKNQFSQSQQINGKTLGILGLGRIGSQVAKTAQCFGMNVIAHDPFIELDQFKKLNVESVGLSEIFRLADVLTLHMPLTKKTRHIINEKTLDMMQSTSFLINTSRGELVKDMALSEALEKKGIAGAALDVFSTEPLPKDNSLRAHKNLLKTPHIGAYSVEAFDLVSKQAVDQTVAYFLNQNPINQLPPEVPWFEF